MQFVKFYETKLILFLSVYFFNQKTTTVVADTHKKWETEGCGRKWKKKTKIERCLFGFQLLNLVLVS